MDSDRLFDSDSDTETVVSPTSNVGEPLAARLRPTRMDDVVGQQHLIGPDGPLRAAVNAGRLVSIILWGPPGTGKTTLAGIIANEIDAELEVISAVSAGIADVRQAVDEAKRRLRLIGRSTIVFIDEIHRFNKRQQDALLPAVEDGIITLIGATTENPSIEVNPALLSRTILYELEPLGPDDLAVLVKRAWEDPLFAEATLDNDAEERLIQAADGDARVLLTALDAVAALFPSNRVTTPFAVTLKLMATALAAPHLRYDRAGDHHYDQISAFIKSIRGSDPDAALYWLVRMLTAGEDPKMLARRMIILASEDVGLADPQALVIAVSAASALDRVGLPEARYALAEACIYLASTPKSNRVTVALQKADSVVKQLGNAPVPNHVRDGHYRGAAKIGHGVGYRYPHDDPSGWVEQDYAPKGLGTLYEPSVHGHEERIASWRRSRREGDVRRTH